MTRLLRIFVALVIVAAAVAMFAAPPKPHSNVKVPTIEIPVVPDHPGVHIVSVKVGGLCNAPATYQVGIQNNLRITADHGQVDVKAANGALLHSRFDNLRAGERRTLTIPSTWSNTCVSNEVGQPSCVEVTISMEPDASSNGQSWDRIAHTVCIKGSNGNAPLVVDHQHKLPM